MDSMRQGEMMKVRPGSRELARSLILGTLLAMLLCSPAGAQDAGSAGEASSAAKAPEAIPAAQIPARASSARVTLDSIRSRLGDATVTDTVDLEQMAEVIDELRQKAEPSRLERLPEFRIAEIQNQVLFYQHELANLEARDIARASRLSAAAAELSRLRGLWTATLAQSERDRLSRPLVEEVKLVLDHIEETERLLDPPLERALAARERASRYETRIETLLRNLEEASSNAKSRRWVRDVAPIWSPGALHTSAARDWTLLSARITDQLRFAEHFLESRRRALELLAAMALVGLAGVAYLRRKGDWFHTTDDTLADASKVLKRPFSSLLLVYLTAALVSSAYAPPVVVSTLAVATMLVLLRLMPGRLVGGHNLLLVGLAVLFMLDRLRAVMPFESLAFRLDQLLVAVGLGAGYLLVLRLKRRGGLPPRSWLSLLARIAPIALVLLAAAVVASLFGNISLADLLVHGTLASTWVSAILFAAAFIVDDFTQMLVRSKLGQKLRMVTLRGPEIAQASKRLTRFLALASWAAITLSSFQLLQPVMARLRDWLAVSWSFGELEFTLGGVATFVVGVLAAFYVARLIRFFLSEELMSRVAWPPGAKSTTATLAYYGVLFAGLLLAPVRHHRRCPRRRHRLRPAERGEQLRLGPDPDVRAADPAGRHHRRGHPAGPGRRDRPAGDPREDLGGRRGHRAQRHHAVRQPDQLDALRQQPSRRDPGRRRLWHQRAARPRPVDEGRHSAAGCHGGPSPGGAVHRLRRGLAGLLRTLLVPGCWNCGHGTQRGLHGDFRGVRGGRHRDPVPAARPAPAQRVSGGEPGVGDAE